MDGNQEIVFYSITDSELLSQDRKEELEKRLKETTNTAIEKTKRVMAKKMQSMGGLDQFGLGK
jgi:DNA-binding protein YbaB